MIRLAQWRLKIPQGDTGAFSLPALISYNSEVETLAVFSIFNERERIFVKEIPVTSDMVTVSFTHQDTKDLPIGKYNWDIKIYINPQHDENGLLIDGDEVHSYYAGFKLPECEIAPAPIHYSW